jgi:hypothetical protein
VNKRNVKAYKLFRLRKDGSLGPLVITARQRIPLGVWLKAEPHRTPGYAFRPGWHATMEPKAPHLSKKGRVWCAVTVRQSTKFVRPKAQGGVWVLAKWIRVDAILEDVS